MAKSTLQYFCVPDSRAVIFFSGESAPKRYSKLEEADSPYSGKSNSGDSSPKPKNYQNK